MIKNRLLITILTIKLTGLALVLLVFFTSFFISNYSRDRLYDSVATVPEKEVGLLLGTSRFLVTGEPNPYFENRIEAAAELYHKGRIQIILASGDHRHASYNEPGAMREALLLRNVPEEAIRMDAGGVSTLESVARAKHVFGLNDVVVISQQFHNERALYIAGHYELEAIGFNAQDVGRLWGIRTVLREYLARVKAMADLHLLEQAPYLD